MKLLLHEVAQRYGYTQQKLAEKMGVSKSCIRSFYLQENMQFETIQRIADAIGCKPWQLIATENQVWQSLEGDVMTPDGKRYHIKDLQYCLDSLVED